MTYDQIEKMSKDDLVYAFKRMTEIAAEATAKVKEMEDRFNDRGDDFEPYGHIGYCEAAMDHIAMRLQVVVDVVSKQ